MASKLWRHLLMSCVILTDNYHHHSTSCVRVHWHNTQNMDLFIYYTRLQKWSLYNANNDMDWFGCNILLFHLNLSRVYYVYVLLICWWVKLHAYLSGRVCLVQVSDRRVKQVSQMIRVVFYMQQFHVLALWTAEPWICPFMQIILNTHLK